VIVTPFIVGFSPPTDEAWVNQVLNITGFGFHHEALIQFRRAGGGRVLAPAIPPLSIDSGNVRVRIPESLHPEVEFEVIVLIDGHESNASPVVRLRGAEVASVTEEMAGRWRLDGHGFTTSRTNHVRFFASIDGGSTELAVVTAMEPGIDGDYLFLTPPGPCLAGPGIKIVVEPEGMLPAPSVVPPRLRGDLTPVSMEHTGLRDAPRRVSSTIGPFNVRVEIRGIGGSGDCEVSAYRSRGTTDHLTVPPTECNLNTGDPAAGLPGGCYVLVFWSFSRRAKSDPGSYQIFCFDALTGQELGSHLVMDISIPATLYMSPDKTVLMALGAERAHIWDLVNETPVPSDPTLRIVSASIEHRTVAGRTEDIIVLNSRTDSEISITLERRLSL
jgi:hypothetical protein